MADKKYSTDKGPDLLWQMIGFVLFLFIIVTFLGKTDFPERFKEATDNTKSENIDGKMSFLSSIFPSGKLAVNQKIINKGTVIVRSEPAGQILGRQNIRETGTILAGPIDRFEKEWWRVDYKNAPDGWVWGGTLTNKTVMFGLFHIIPITYNLIKPFLILMSIVIFILILIIILKSFDLKRVNEKKKQYILEQEYYKKGGVEKSTNINADNEESSQSEISGLPTGTDYPKTESPKNRRWSHIQTLINSHNVNDWRQAIIEADIILEEMLDKMGYKGDSIGDKLKKVEKSDFLTLDSAWEAHKIRNRIAHKGSNYILSKDDADRAIEMYRQVFSEFYFI
ncbi:MAG TPA: hypothetical protein PKA60_02170 [Candidatus Paceibacterota bacterium]|nr:hypothetical protein [Candidatus Paceibacterota bacterium]